MDAHRDALAERWGAETPEQVVHLLAMHGMDEGEALYRPEWYNSGRGLAPPLGHWGRVWGGSSSQRRAFRGFLQMEQRCLGQLLRPRPRPPDFPGAFFVPGSSAGTSPRTGVRGAAGAAFGKERSDAQGARSARPERPRPVAVSQARASHPPRAPASGSAPQRRSKGGAGSPEQWYTVQGRWLMK